MGELRIVSVEGLPEIAAGDDLAALIARSAGDELREGAIVCVAHKLVSKAEGRVVALDEITAGPRAIALAGRAARDPRHVQVILNESMAIVRSVGPVLICRTRHGFVCANAGVDQSNAAGDGQLVLLPIDPDASARALRAGLLRETGLRSLAVLISDSFGRAWRIGQADIAIGLAGLPAIVDHQGRADRDGRPLQGTEPAIADEVAAAADLVRTKAGGQGAVILHGLAEHITAADGPGAAALRRAPSDDLFG